MRDISNEVKGYKGTAAKSIEAQNIYSGFAKGDLTRPSAVEAFNRKPYYMTCNKEKENRGSE